MLVKPFVATIREISSEFGTPVLLTADLSKFFIKYLSEMDKKGAYFSISPLQLLASIILYSYTAGYSLKFTRFFRCMNGNVSYNIFSNLSLSIQILIDTVHKCNRRTWVIQARTSHKSINIELIF